jgi:hypothetical protein
LLSKQDQCRRLFDHLVRAGEEGRRDCEV